MQRLKQKRLSYCISAYTADVRYRSFSSFLPLFHSRGSLLVCFHLCHVSVLLLETKFFFQDLFPLVVCTLGKKCFCKTSFQLEMSLKKGQKQGRDERTHEDYLTSAKYTADVRLVFFAFFHLCLVSVLF